MQRQPIKPARVLLALLFIVAGLGALAQPRPPVNGEQRTSGPSPSTERLREQQPATSLQPTNDAPFPVRIIESPAEAISRKEQEETSNRHEAEDLKAQIRAATAAEEQVLLARVNLVVAIVGGLLLLVTLKETRRAAHAAVAAAEAGRDSAKAAQESVNLTRASERAYVMAESVAHNFLNWRISAEKNFNWSFQLTNHGRTPAKILSIATLVTISDGNPLKGGGWDNAGAEFENNAFMPLAFKELGLGFVLKPGASTEPYVETGDRLITKDRGHPLPEAFLKKLDRLYEKTAAHGVTLVWMIGSVAYRDMFGVEHHTDFCWGIDQPFGTVSERGGPDMNAQT